MTAPVATAAGVVIREASPADVPRLVEMGVGFIASTVYAGRLTARPEAIDRRMRWMLDIGLEDAALFVAERAGELVGMIGMVRYPHLLTEEIVAGELFWWVEPSARTSSAAARLLQRAEAWAWSVGADLLQMIAPTPEVERIYDKRGYERIEVAYQKRREG